MTHRYEQALEVGKFHRHFNGSFTPSGAGVSSASGANRGVGFTPSHTGTTGVYRLSLLDALGSALAFTRLISCALTFQSENAYTTPTHCVVGAVNEANGTIDVLVWAESAGTQALANVTASGVLRRINFAITVAVDDVPGGGASA